MTSITFGLLYFSASIFTAIPSVWAGWAWSGYGYSGARFRTAFIYIIFLSYLHIQFFLGGKIPFSSSEHETLLQLFSLAFALIHFSRLPDKRERRQWVFGKKPSQTLSFKKIDTKRSYTFADSIFYGLKIILLGATLSASLSVFATAGIFFIVELFYPLSKSERSIIFFIAMGVTIFIVICGLKNTHKDGMRY